MQAWRHGVNKAKRQQREAQKRELEQEKERVDKELEEQKKLAREVERARQETRKSEIENRARLQKALDAQNTIMRKANAQRIKLEDEARDFASRVSDSNKQQRQIPTTINQMRSMSQLVFDRYDPDGTGSISTSKLRVMCYDYGYYLDEIQFQVQKF